MLLYVQNRSLKEEKEKEKSLPTYPTFVTPVRLKQWFNYFWPELMNVWEHKVGLKC